MYKKRKHLVRCRALVLRREDKNTNKSKSDLTNWTEEGYVDFEVDLDIIFVMGAEEDILDIAFAEMIKEHNTDDLRYKYIDFELIFNSPIKLNGNPVKTYKNKFEANAKDFVKTFSTDL
jgi:hypothetical protein